MSMWNYAKAKWFVNNAADLVLINSIVPFNVFVF